MNTLKPHFVFFKCEFAPTIRVGPFEGNPPASAHADLWIDNFGIVLDHADVRVVVTSTPDLMPFDEDRTPEEDRAAFDAMVASAHEAA